MSLNRFKLKNFLLGAVAAFILLLAFAAPVAAEYWNTPTSPLLGSGATTPTTAKDICEDLFKGDPGNVYGQSTCELLKLISLSATNFSQELACKIQQIGNSANYNVNVKFDFASGQCNPDPPDALKFTSPSTTSSSTTAKTVSALTEAIQPVIGASGTTTDTAVYTAYKVVRNIVSVLIVIALLIVAFANILHIELNTYSVKKALPAIVLTLVGSWLAIFVIYYFSRVIDSLYILSSFSPSQALNPIQNIFGGSLSTSSTVSTAAAATSNSSMQTLFQVGGALVGGSTTFVSGILGTILLVVPGIIVFVFEYVLALRAYAVQFLTIIAPLALVCSIFPQTQGIFRKWWTILLIALLYAPIVNFIFFILNALPAATGTIPTVIALAFKSLVVVVLIRMPFKVESDLKTVSVALAKTGIGNQLGFGALARSLEKKPSRQESQTVTDKVFTNQLAKNIVADTGLKRFARAISGTAEPPQNKENQTGFAHFVSRANQTNLNRSTDLLSRSVADLPTDVFQKVIERSDAQVWRDPKLISSLKNASEHVLDDEGAALRADSARKLVRLAEVVENDKIKNPDALKLLAQKGALSNVSLPVLKKALQEGVLATTDFNPTYKAQTQKVLSALQAIETRGVRFADSRTASSLIAQDHQDYSSGFKDTAKILREVSRSPNINAVTPELTRAIMKEIKSSPTNELQANGTYFIKRLAQEQKNAQMTIAQNLKTEGVNNQIASAIALNPAVSYSQATSYLPKPRQTASTLEPLREAFLKRDLAQNLNSEVSKAVIEEKTVMARGITEKIASALKSQPSSDLGQIKNQLESSIKQLSGPISPQEALNISKSIEQYHPVATLKVDSEFTESDIAKTKEKAQSALETVDDLMKSGADKKSIIDDPQKALESVAGKIKETIQKAGAVSAPTAAPAK